MKGKKTQNLLWMLILTLSLSSMQEMREKNDEREALRKDREKVMIKRDDDWEIIMKEGIE